MCLSSSSRSQGGAAALPAPLHQSLNPPSSKPRSPPPLLSLFLPHSATTVAALTCISAYLPEYQIARWIVPSWLNSWIPHNSFSTHSLFFLLLHNLRRGNRECFPGANVLQVSSPCIGGVESKVKGRIYSKLIFVYCLIIFKPMCIFKEEYPKHKLCILGFQMKWQAGPLSGMRLNNSNFLLNCVQCQSKYIYFVVVNYSQSLPGEDSFSIALKTFCKTKDCWTLPQPSWIRISRNGTQKSFPLKKSLGIVIDFTRLGNHWDIILGGKWKPFKHQNNFLNYI